MKLIDIDALLDADVELPDKVRSAAVAARALSALEVPPSLPAPPDARSVEIQVISACVASAEAGKPKLPDVARVADAEKVYDAWLAESEARDYQAMLLRSAAQEARVNAAELLGEHHEAVIRGLSAALDAVMAEVRTLAPQIRGLTPGVVLRLADDVREAYTRFELLVGRYSSIRFVQRMASDAVGGARVDEAGWFSTFRNLVQLHPQSYRKMFASPPWPAGDLREFLVWCVDHPEYVLWCPTPAERDAEFEKVIGVQVAGQMGRRAVGV